MSAETKALAEREASMDGKVGEILLPNGRERAGYGVAPRPLPCGEVVRKIRAYIKRHGLQNPANRREILADAKLELVFGKKKVTMFEMNKHLAQHLK
jgi:upstream activation factor subunit UAF30